MQNGPLDFFREVCEKELFRRIWQARLRKAEKAKFKSWMPHSPWFAQFVRKTYFATIGQKTPTSKNSPVQVQNGPFDLFGPVCGKEVIRRICMVRKTTKTQKAVFRCRMAHSTWFAQFMRKIISPHLAGNAAKRPKAVFKCTMPTSTWIPQFVGKNYFALFGQKDSQKPKEPCSGVQWRTWLDSPSFYEIIISLYLAIEAPKSPKSRVQVQNGPFDLIRLVCERKLLLRIWQARLQKP